MTYTELKNIIPAIPHCHTTAVIAKRGAEWLLLGVGRDAAEAEKAAAGKILVTEANGWTRYVSQIQR